MSGWKCSNDRKIHQRALNATVRKLNKNIVKDDLWQGRFFVRQRQAWMHHYEDGSGGYLFVHLEMCDRKTGRTLSIYDTSNHFTNWGGNALFWALNNFIVDTIDVWCSEDPIHEKYDWNTDKNKLDKFNGFGKKGK
jgi:hypothetical protein